MICILFNFCLESNFEMVIIQSFNTRCIIESFFLLARGNLLTGENYRIDGKFIDVSNERV